MFNCFQGQTNMAAFDVDFNIFSKAWLIIFPNNKLYDFIDTKIVCQKIVVVPATGFSLNDFKYKQ